MGPILATSLLAMALFGGVEAGGTKFVCAVGDGRGSLAHFVRFPTTTPEETLRRVVQFFETLPQAPVAIVVVMWP